MKKEIYSSLEVCEMLGISYSKLTKSIAAKEMQGFKIKGEGPRRFFTPEEIRKYQQFNLDKRNKNVIVAITEIGFKERIEKTAKEKKIDINTYILQAIKERVEKDERE